MVGLWPLFRYRTGTVAHATDGRRIRNGPVRYLNSGHDGFTTDPTPRFTSVLPSFEHCEPVGRWPGPESGRGAFVSRARGTVTEQRLVCWYNIQLWIQVGFQDNNGLPF